MPVDGRVLVWDDGMNYVNYIRALEAVGLTAAVGREAVPDCAALLLPGGGDITDNALPEDEWQAVAAFAAAEKPVLGICRGLQVLNVALGGSLVQDLPSQRPDSPICHQQPQPPEVATHPVRVDAQSRLAHIIGAESLMTNSHHHQAVKQPAPGAVVSARAEDGLIEGIEFPNKRFMLGLQWHPEHMWQNYASARRIWSAFVSAAKQ